MILSAQTNPIVRSNRAPSFSKPSQSKRSAVPPVYCSSRTSQASATPASLANRLNRGHHASKPVPLTPGGEEKIPGYGKAWTGPVPKDYALPTYDFPAVLELSETHTEDASLGKMAWGQAARNKVDALLRESPAVILRGLPLETAIDYKNVILGLNYARASYTGSFIERNEADGLYDATANPDNFLLSPHNENIFYSSPPSKIIFCMTQPATDFGGESILLRNSDLTRAVGPQMVDHFAKKGGLKHTWWYPSAEAKSDLTKVFPLANVMPTWESWFGGDRQTAEEQAMKRGLTVTWDDPKPGLWATNVLPATRPDHITGEDLWLNAADLSGVPYFFTIAYGDGTPLDAPTKDALRNARWQNAVALPLQKGDILIIDNLRCQHGRTPFKGKRGMRVEMCE